MPVFYFHLRNRTDVVVDGDGGDMSLDDAVARAMIEARALIADKAMHGRMDMGQRIDVEDADGAIVHTVRFTQAVHIIEKAGVASTN